MSHTVSAALVGAGVLAALGAIIPILWPEQLLSVLGASATVAAAGADYLRLSAVALVPTVMVAVFSGAMRSTGKARSPMLATFVTVPLNTALAYCLVLGVGPFPNLGVAGAGWALLITASVKLVILAALTYGVHRIVSWQLPVGVAEWRSILVPMFVLAIPLGLTELLWSTGTFLYNVIAQQLGDAPLAAIQIASTLEAIFIVGSVGLMSATTALVGQSVGLHEASEARRWAGVLARAGVYTGVVFGILLILSAFSVPLLFANAGREVQVLAIIGIVINGLSQVIKVRNMILGAGVMPSGGDVRGVVIGDGVSAFLVGLPLALVLALATPLGVVGLFLARVIEEAAKLAIFTMRTRRISWEAVVRREEAITS